MIPIIYLFKGLFLITFLIILNRLNSNEIDLNIIKVLILLNSLISDVLKQKHLYISLKSIFKTCERFRMVGL